MKKIHYVLALAVVVAFSACNPLDKTYKQLGDLPTPAAPAVSADLTLSPADYALAPKGSFANKNSSFKSTDSAKLQVPVILAAKYPTYGEKSKIVVTYATAPLTIKLADSAYNNVAYTAVNPTDYTNSSSVTGTFYKDWSAAQVLLFLTYKYPNPVANQLVLLTYQYYESGVTPSSGVTTTDSFLYLNGAWIKIYTITAAQYAAAGRGNYGNFTSGDMPNLPAIFNGLLKADITVAANAKAGDVKYVSYKYYASGNYQRVLPLTFDGTNWVSTPVAAAPLSFIKTDGTWVADNTVNYKLILDDYAYIGDHGPAGSAAAKNNIKSYPDFNISNSTDPTYWSSDDIKASILFWITYKYSSTAVANQKFNITYTVYNKGVTSDVTVAYVYDGTTFKLQ